MCSTFAAPPAACCATVTIGGILMSSSDASMNINSTLSWNSTPSLSFSISTSVLKLTTSWKSTFMKINLWKINAYILFCISNVENV